MGESGGEWVSQGVSVWVRGECVSQVSGQNPTGQNPIGQYPSGQKPRRTKTQGDKIQWGQKPRGTISK